MIEKRAPRVSSLPEDDDMANTTTELHDEDAGLDPQHDGEEEHEFDRTLDDPEIDPIAEAKRRKRNGNLIFYGGIVVVLTIVGFLALPTFKQALGIRSGPAQTAGPAVVVPQGARENHFKLADGSNSAPVAPPGAIGTAPAGQLPAPTPGTPPQTATNITPSGPNTTPSVPMPPDSVAMQPASSLGSPPTAGRPVAVAPPPQASPAIPAEPLAKQADLTALSGKVDGMATMLTSLATDKDANTAQLKQIQTSLDSLQHQIADLATVKAAQPAPKPEIAKPARTTVHRERVTRSIPGFSLRSATPDMALLAQNGSSDLQKVSVGDTIPKLGRILSISEYNGRWIVKGTGGSVMQ